MHSIIPAPVASRSSLTSPAEIVVLTGSPPLRSWRPARRSPAPSVVGGCRLRGDRIDRVDGLLALAQRLVLGGRLVGSRWRRSFSGQRLVRGVRLVLAGGAAVRGGGELGLGDAGLTGGHALGDRAHDQAAGADRVVVAGNHVVGLVGVAVRVDERDDRQPEPARLADRELLLLQVDDEDRVGLAAQVGDPAEVRLELLELGEHRDPLLRGEQLELALVLQPAQLVQVRDPVRDRLPVRQQPAQPAMVHVGHADARSLLGDRVLRLLLRADEEDAAAAARDVAGEVVGLLEQLGGLLQVDDVDPAALGEDEALHLRVPAAGLVAEVDSGLQELAHGDDRPRGG